MEEAKDIEFGLKKVKLVAPLHDPIEIPQIKVLEKEIDEREMD